MSQTNRCDCKSIGKAMAVVSQQVGCKLYKNYLIVSTKLGGYSRIGFVDVGCLLIWLRERPIKIGGDSRLGTFFFVEGGA
jgi:hypothetical protein